MNTIIINTIRVSTPPGQAACKLLNAKIVFAAGARQVGALNGPIDRLNERVGRSHGNNLFHGFSQFDLSANQSARFNGQQNIDILEL